MIESILVPLDGSSLSEGALVPSVWWAERLDASIRLMRTEPEGEYEDLDDYLRRTAELVRGQVTTKAFRYRHPPDAILIALENLTHPALCMATRGRSGMSELLLGSTAAEVIGRVTIPLFLLGPAHVNDAAREDTIVCALDGSGESSVLLPAVAALAKAGRCRIHVVTVAETGLPNDARAVAAEEVVRSGAGELEALGVDCTSHVLYGARAGEQIVSLAAKVSARLIGAGTHGSSGVCAKSLGSVATHLVQHSRCPVLVRRLRN